MRGAIELDTQQIESGVVQDGIFKDSDGHFSIEIPNDWKLESGTLFGEKVLRISSPLQEYAVEIRKLPLDTVNPVPHQECIWAFADQGLYQSDNQLTHQVATCYPIEESDMIIFVYMRRDDFYTWQLEGQVNPNYLVEGGHVTANIIDSIIWSDVSVDQSP